MRRSTIAAFIGGLLILALTAAIIRLNPPSPGKVGPPLPLENEENWHPSLKPLWWVPEENMEEFISAAENENLYRREEGVTYVSYCPRFRELIEKYGGCWEDENGEVHRRS